MNQADTDQSPENAKLEDSLQHVQQELNQLQVNNRASNNKIKQLKPTLHKQ